jgi:putative intracellular protease/amidase
MTQAVHVAVYDGLADWEIGLVTAQINDPAWQREPGAYQVVTIGESAEAVVTMGGFRVTPEVSLADVDPPDSAMLILPGAGSWLAGGNAAFAEKARAFLDAGVPVAAICGATAGLAAAGLLDDRAHTSNAPEVLAWTGYAGADHYRDEPAVTDRNVITATAIAPVAFAREILGVLGTYTPDVLASWFKLYGDGDPAGYAELMAAA